MNKVIAEKKERIKEVRAKIMELEEEKLLLRAKLAEIRKEEINTSVEIKGKIAEVNRQRQIEDAIRKELKFIRFGNRDKTGKPIKVEN